MKNALLGWRLWKGIEDREITGQIPEIFLNPTPISRSGITKTKLPDTWMCRPWQVRMSET
ncbi:MAG: hypothetical protein WDM78_05075 [Puia sp.]